MEQNPDVRVEYTPLDLQLYNEKMVALFNAGTQPDAYYVRDTNLGAWVEAGWVQPIDGSAARQITHFPADGQQIWGLSWSADGRLAVGRASIRNNIILFRGLKQAR